jgi:cardiolipin synthase
MTRALVTPWVVIAVMHDRRSLALLLCASAGFTDFLDGWLARRFGWITRIGAWTDAIADKILLSSLFVAFGLAGWVPKWLVVLVLGRDLLILLLAGVGLVFTPIRDFPPSLWGKVSTNVQILTALTVLTAANPAVSSMLPTVIGLCATFTMLSGLHYVSVAIRRYRNLGRNPD